MATPEERVAFVERFWCQAESIGTATGFFPELVMATWAIDTGWGNAQAMMDCHALLGIVCFDPGRYPCTLCNPSLCFYCYPTWEDFFATFQEVLLMRHYDVVRAQSTPEGQAEALANQTGFAGAPPNPEYLQSLLAVMAAILAMEPACTAPPPPPPPGTTTTVSPVVPLLLGTGLLYASVVLLRNALRGEG